MKIAFEAAEKCISLDNKNYIGYYYKSQIYLHQGEHEKAIAWADQGVNAPFIGQKNWATMSAKGAVLAAAGIIACSVLFVDTAFFVDTALMAGSVSASAITFFQAGGWASS